MPRCCRVVLITVIALAAPFAVALAAELTYVPSIDFWAGVPIVPVCTKIPVEPFDDADHQSIDYAVGLLFLEYDLNGDGRSDFMTARQIEKISQTLSNDRYTEEDTSPLFYWVDLDANSSYDQLWIDQGGHGRCEDIVPYDRDPARNASDAWTQNVMATPAR